MARATTQRGATGPQLEYRARMFGGHGITSPAVEMVAQDGPCGVCKRLVSEHSREQVFDCRKKQLAVSP